MRYVVYNGTLIFLTTFIWFVFGTSVVGAQFTSTNYLIDSYIIGDTGGVYGSSTNFINDGGTGEVYVYTVGTAVPSSSGGGGSRDDDDPIATTTPATTPAPTKTPPVVVTAPFAPEPEVDRRELTRDPGGPAEEVTNQSSGSQDSNGDRVEFEEGDVSHTAPKSNALEADEKGGLVHWVQTLWSWDFRVEWIGFGLLSIVLLTIILVVTRGRKKIKEQVHSIEMHIPNKKL